ncbi:unnamed protein product, partial [Rotaria magnacalcarata]
MIPNDPENNMSISSNVTTLAQPSMATISSTSDKNNSSVISTLITTDTRRSVRISVKSPKRTPSSSNQLNLHRTISGGVANSNSPKFNAPKRTSGSVDTQGTSTSSISYSTITTNDNGGIQLSNNNNSTPYRDLLPSDQSDDDEMLTNSSVMIKQKSTGLATRSEVLSYFLVQNNGYKCKLCDKAPMFCPSFHLKSCLDKCNEKIEGLVVPLPLPIRVYQCHKKSDANLRKHLASLFHQVTNVLYASQLNDDSNVDVPVISPERKRESHTAAID